MCLNLYFFRTAIQGIFFDHAKHLWVPMWVGHYEWALLASELFIWLCSRLPLQVFDPQTFQWLDGVSDSPSRETWIYVYPNLKIGCTYVMVPIINMVNPPFFFVVVVVFFIRNINFLIKIILVILSLVIFTLSRCL